MLHELHIRNFAIIDDLHLNFGPGLNVLTGETGAGKSIIIDALGLLLGDRASAEWIRAGTERAEIEATFGLPAIADPNDSVDDEQRQEDLMLDDIAQQARHLLKDGGLDDPDNPEWVVLSREVRASGRNICRVNGRSVGVQVLGEIAGLFVDVHGQGEHLNLLQPKTHVHLLDRYAGLTPLRRQVSTLVSKLRKIRTQLNELNQDARTIAQRLDMLTFQVEEIEDAELQPDEDTSLENERRRLGNAETLLSLAQGAQSIISEAGEQDTPSVVDLLGEAAARIDKLTRIDPSMEPLALEAQSMLEQLGDLSSSLEDYTHELEFDPRRLQEVEERIELLENLKRKYGDTIEQVIAFGEEASAELDELDSWEGRTEALEAEEEALLREIGGQAASLSTQRQAAGETLARQVEKELADLRMEKAQCGVAVEHTERENGAFHPDGRRVSFDGTGIDRVEFMLSTNPGEPLKPMAKVASGGETARIMLAIKSVLAHADATPTLIFDEIDQGIGGRVGSVVGHKLWALTDSTIPAVAAVATTNGSGVKKKSKGAKNKASTKPSDATHLRHQVLCITHLPQLAAFGDQHFTVNKRVQPVDGEERTSTVVSLLDGEPRIDELMQMLGATTEAGRQSVEEMLMDVARIKGK